MEHESITTYRQSERGGMTSHRQGAVHSGIGLGRFDYNQELSTCSKRQCPQMPAPGRLARLRLCARQRAGATVLGSPRLHQADRPAGALLRQPARTSVLGWVPCPLLSQVFARRKVFQRNACECLKGGEMTDCCSRKTGLPAQQ